MLAAAWEDECEAVLVFDITADAFMRNMIRVLVGTMLEVGGGKRTVAGFEELLDGAPREARGKPRLRTGSTSRGSSTAKALPSSTQSPLSNESGPRPVHRLG